MFDNENKNYNYTTNNLKISAVSGGIYKSYKESWFLNFKFGSEISGIILNEFGKC